MPAISADSPPEPATHRQAVNPHALVNEDLKAVDTLIQKQPDSELKLINTVGEYILGGGKKLRPVVALLAFYAAGGATGDKRRIVLAAAIELLHIATLLHDDVVDQSDLRRGRKTANIVWSNEACLLIGDFLYSRAFQLLTGLESHPVMRDIACTTNEIAEGEVAQFVNKRRMGIDESTYMLVIQKKTAVLFRAAARNGATLAGGTPEIIAAMSDYGHHLGMAFQLFDDILDYNIERDKKVAGDDLHNGKLTLPVIHALRHANAKDAAFIRDAFERRERGDLDRVVEIMHTTGSIDYTLDKAHTHTAQANLALNTAPETLARNGLSELTRMAITHE